METIASQNMPPTSRPVQFSVRLLPYQVRTGEHLYVRLLQYYKRSCTRFSHQQQQSEPDGRQWQSAG